MISLDQIPHQHQALGRVYSEGLRLARQNGRKQLVSVVRPAPFPIDDPLDLLNAAQSLELDAMYWSVPKRRFTLLSVGEAAAFEGTGNDRFKQVAQAWRQLAADALIDTPTAMPGTGPILMGGFTFDPLTPAQPMWDGFPDARLVLPQITVTLADDQAWITHNLVVDPASRYEVVDDSLALAEDLCRSAAPPIDTKASLALQGDDREIWIDLVRQAAAGLGDGELEKVVMARAVTARADLPLSPSHALSILRSTYPDCFLFSFTRGGRTFLGATPEQLIRLHGRDVETMCLAASIARGRDPEEDQRLGDALLGSDKERQEHRLVLSMIRSELGAVCDEIVHPDEPTLLKLGNVQHLYTPMRARRREGVTVFDVLERLHPTPAVGGTPRPLAMEFIRRYEGFHRGWYASPVGWVDLREEGEFAVALRSAVVEGETATLFAGCGIMPDSDPAAEYEESCLKLRPMMHALGGCA